MQLLNQVRVAKPCPASWNEMEGDSQVRHCSLCKHNVYNLSEMTEKDAEDLLRRAEGRLCVRYYQRTDGKIMTKDCPKGLALARRRMATSLVAVAAVWVSAASFLLARPIPRAKFEQVKSTVADSEPIKTIIEKLVPQPSTVMGAMPTPTTGMVAYPAPTPAAVPAPKPAKKSKGKVGV